MLKTKLYIALALVAALLLAPATYAADDTTTGQFNAAASTPEVTNIEIYTDLGCTDAAEYMDPLNQYYAKVDVSLANGLKHLDTVQATLYYDVDGDHSPVLGSGDLHDCAILTCTVDPTTPVWAIDAGTSTTWAIVSDNCTQPNLNTTSGSWIFAFNVGKVARENTGAAEWDAEGKATRGTKFGVDYVYNKDMNWYGEITVNSPAVDWGEVPLGLTSDNSTYNPETNISVNYIANGDYNEDISSTDWSNAGPPIETVTLNTTGTEPLTTSGEFGLKASWHNFLTDNVTVTANPAYATINNTGTISATEAGVDVTTNTLWLSLSTSGIAPVTYSGTIWYQIANP